MSHGCMELGLCDLCKGASFTSLAPLLDILSHAWPVASLMYQIGGPFNTLMTMFIMEFLQHFLLQTIWQQELILSCQNNKQRNSSP